jgi:PKD repeat protein
MQGRTSVLKHGWLVLLLVVLTTAASASTAGAVVVHLGGGHTAGVTPIRGVSPSSIPGSVAGSRTAKPFSTSDNLSWNGGPVLHGVKPYLIFWDPTGTGISSADRALYERFFADSAAASGQSTNVWGVDRQFTDSTGFADYSQSWTSTQAINDTHAYPTTGQCTEGSYSGETACLYDAQLQAEVQRLITADSLPDGTTGQAPLYFVVTPPTVNTCFSDNSTCADNYYCAYHSSFTDSASNTVLYSDIPTILDVQDPKGCQDDGNSAVQAPNGASTATADGALKAVSHEMSETITDPVNSTGWWNTSNGQEDGDQCNFYGSYNPANDYNPNAFLPTLGGSATGSPDGTLYNQLINSNRYYIQSEWSNGDGNCQMQPTSSAISAAFTAPSTTVAPGTSVNFDPTASSSAGGYTSTTWNFGDGSSSFSTSAPALKSHTFSTVGTYTVTLTLVDKYGNLSTVSHVVQVAAISASFTATPTHPQVNQTVSLDGSASSDNEGTINSYTWNFGDGTTPVTTAGPTTTHAYTTSGAKTITLTVSDGTHTSAPTTRTVTVDNPPTAAFSTTTAHPTATFPTSFDGSASSESGGSISSYSWDFGDGSSAGSGATPSHTFVGPGTYDVVLTVTDQDGYTASVTHQVTVGSAPVAQFSVPTSSPTATFPTSFDGSASSESGGSIASYSWDFGDGSPAGTGASPNHTYATSGSRTVTLTVTDQDGHTDQISHEVSVASPPVVASPATPGVPTAALTFSPAKPVALARVSFSGGRSTDIGSALVSYSWTFGDRATASGIAPSHTYARPGTYHATVTVRDATGASSSSSRTITVIAPGFTGVRIKTSRTVELIRLSLSGPGTLVAGRKHVRLKHAGVITYRLVLTRAQRTTLRAHHRLHIKLAFRFVPTIGASSHRTVAFTVKP